MQEGMKVIREAAGPIARRMRSTKRLKYVMSLHPVTLYYKKISSMTTTLEDKLPSKKGVRNFLL